MFLIVIVLLSIMLDIMLKLYCLFPFGVIWDFRCSLLENFLYVTL